MSRREHDKSTRKQVAQARGAPQAAHEQVGRLRAQQSDGQRERRGLWRGSVALFLRASSTKHLMLQSGGGDLVRVLRP